LALSRYVTAIALGENVLPHRRHGFAGDDLATDRGLDGHFVQLSRDQRLQLLDQLAALDLRLGAVRDQRERVDRLAGDEDVDLDQLALAETDHLVVHRRVALRTRLQLVVEVVNDLAQRYFILEDDTVART